MLTSENESKQEAVFKCQGTMRKQGQQRKETAVGAENGMPKIISTDHFPDGSVNIPHFALKFKEKSEVLKFLLIMPKSYVNCVM